MTTSIISVARTECSDVTHEFGAVHARFLMFTKRHNFMSWLVSEYGIIKKNIE